MKYATLETVTLSPLPCWKPLSPEKYRERIAAMVTEIEENAERARKREGIQPLGREAILAQHPHTRPKKVKKSCAPFVHAACKETRLFFRQIYSEFLEKYRTAAKELRAGDRTVRFPLGCFPSALPFVSG